MDVVNAYFNTAVLFSRIVWVKRMISRTSGVNGLDILSVLDIFPLNLLLLMAYLANTKRCKKPKEVTDTWVLIWKYSARATQWIPTCDKVYIFFRKSLCSCILEESSLSIVRVKPSRLQNAQIVNGLNPLSPHKHLLYYLYNFQAFINPFMPEVVTNILMILMLSH